MEAVQNYGIIYHLEEWNIEILFFEYNQQTKSIFHCKLPRESKYGSPWALPLGPYIPRLVIIQL